MKRRAFVANVIGGALLLTGCGSGSDTPVPSLGTEQRTAEELARTVREKYRLPAIGAAVIKSDGPPTVLAVDGVRQVGRPERVATEDRWHIGSCAKSMTAVLLAGLVSEGRLTWDSKPADVIPEMKGRIHPDYAGATLRQILRMRAGLPAVTPGDLAALPPASGTPGEQRRSLTGYVLSLSAASTPGEAVYSNASYVVAAAMAEAVTGDTWENMIRQRVLRPIGADGSLQFGWPAKGNPSGIFGHKQNGETWLAQNPDGPAEQIPAFGAPAGDISLTLNDWAKWAQADLRGQRGLPTALPADVWQAVHEGEPFNDGLLLAMGWAETTRKGSRASAFTGSAADTFYAGILVQPERDQAILVITNAASEKAETGLRELTGGLTK